MITRGSSETSGPLRWVMIIASALLIVINSRASESSVSASASSYRAIALSTSFSRTFARPAWRSSSIRSSRSSIAVISTLPATLVVPRVHLLPALELDEALHFLLRVGAETAELRVDRLFVLVLFEEVADAEIERAEDLQQRVQA